MRGWAALTRGRVNPLVPVLAVIVGAGCAGGGQVIIGAGIAVGGVLAYVNGLLLSRRVDLAALTGNIGAAMMVMQIGLLITLAVIAVATIILIKISPAMAVASVASFAVAHLLILGTFYWTHARPSAAVETKA